MGQLEKKAPSAEDQKSFVAEINLEQLVGLFKHTQNQIQNQVAKVVDTSLVLRNWLFGWYIAEFEIAGKNRQELYGKKLLQKLAEKLKAEGLDGLSTTNLKLFRKFYESYSDIGQALPDQSKKQSKLPQKRKKIGPATPDLSGSFEQIVSEKLVELGTRFKLGWTHYVTLLPVKSEDVRKFYELEALENDWGYRELDRQINSALYERLALSRDKNKVKELSEKGQIVTQPKHVLKNPFVLEFLELKEHPHYSEHQLETAIIDKLELFLLELGKGFLFEARQKRFSFDNQHFFVDLVFYNRLLQCYVLIDLKIGKLKHQDLGQMQMYVNYFDRIVKKEFEHPTVGIVLCHEKNNSIVELTLPKESNIYASEYQLYLPSKEELQKQLQEAQAELEEVENG